METCAYFIAPGGQHTCHSCHQTKGNLLPAESPQVSLLVGISSLFSRSMLLSPLVAVVGYSHPRTAPFFLLFFLSHLPHCVLTGKTSSAFDQCLRHRSLYLSIYLFIYLLAVPHSMQGLNSLTRNRTHAFCSGSTDS